MTEAASTEVAAPAAPANAIEAAARLATLKSDSAWSGKFIGGDRAAMTEYHDLNEMVAKGDPVEMAMSGILDVMPDSDQKLLTETASMLRTIGINDGTVEQTLRGREMTQQEFDAVSRWKTQHLKDAEWTKKLLAGDAEAMKEMTLANIVLTSTIKGKKGSF